MTRADEVSGPRAVVQAFAQRGWTLATCESLTAGLLAATVATVPGASQVLRGGLVTYATDLKASLAGVDTALLARAGAVDAQVALAMARGARDKCQASVGIACTGVAGPDPQDGKAVGTVFVAVAWGSDVAGGDVAGGVSGLEVPAGAREDVRELALSGTRSSIRSATVDECLFTLMKLCGE